MLVARVEEVRARHILFKVDEKAPEQEVEKVKGEALKVLQEARGGKDFAELAKKYSQDEGSAKQGGDLGFFTRERMVPEFSEAAFALKPGQISDLVRSHYGFHIIKTEEVHPEKTDTFDEVKDRLIGELKQDKAKDLAYKKARELADSIHPGYNLRQAAAESHLAVMGGDTWVSRQEALPGLSEPLPEAMKALFALSENDLSNILDAPDGYLLAQVRGILPPQVPPFEKVRDRVKVEYKTAQAHEAAQKGATEFLEAVKKAGGNLDAVAKERNLEVKSSLWFSRREPDKEFKPLSAEAQGKIFRLNAAAPLVDVPVEFGNRYAVCRFVDKKSPDELLAKERPGIVERLTQSKENALWDSWITERRAKAVVVIFKETR